MLVALTNCKSTPKREEINAVLWLNNSPIYKEYCERQPQLKDFGFYRRLNEGGFEFISFCDPKANEWIAIFKDDFLRLLDKYVPEDKKKNAMKEARGLLYP